MKKFIGRKEEINALAKAYRSPKSEFVVIYGRRRVGKSELILQFIKKRAAIYYLGKKATTAFQINEFLNESAESIKDLKSLSADKRKNLIDSLLPSKLFETTSTVIRSLLLII